MRLQIPSEPSLHQAPKAEGAKLWNGPDHCRLQSFECIQALQIERDLLVGPGGFWEIFCRRTHAPGCIDQNGRESSLN